MDKINVEVIQGATNSLTSGVSDLSKTISDINSVIDELSLAWNSSNSSLVKYYISKIVEDVMSLGLSVTRIKEKINYVVGKIVDSDSVSINSGNDE